MSGIGRAVRSITPECSNLGNGLMLSGIIFLVITLITFILVLVGVIYNYYYKPTADEDVTKKEKYIGGCLIAGTVMLAISTLIGVWHIIVSSQVKKCVSIVTPN